MKKLALLILAVAFLAPVAVADWLECKCDPYVLVDYQVSVAQGGTCTFLINGGVFAEGSGFVLLASASGTTPGVPYAGVTIPLVGDDLFLWSFANPYNGFLQGSPGNLGQWGVSHVTWTVPPETYTALAGTFLHFAFFRSDASGTHVSNPVLVKLVP